MEKIKDTKKRLDNLTAELEIFLNKRIILRKRYNILLIKD
jgi:hypothetical protein